MVAWLAHTPIDGLDVSAIGLKRAEIVFVQVSLSLSLSLRLLSLTAKGCTGRCVDSRWSTGPPP